ncbi:SOS response-associated peptidase [Undibacterium sp. FT79W]|uniref:SOS response-associated peptidase n=1 Tax=Undibacterium sp. FT79W TaxID=2762296 RepID=UPI002107E088|nr:SOS response-associated peptidase family protein [Undibacterium sp. FT79W]
MNYLFATKIKLFLQDRHMCVNYTPTRKEALADFGVNGQQLDDYKAETWQDYAAPIIRHDNHGEREVMLASYGMIPKDKMPIGAKRYSTMNARAETIGQLRTYAKPWREGMLCLVPMQHFFEPCYESGKAERWKIGLKDEADFAVAGIYQEWDEIEGAKISYSFTQITINANDHPLMKRFHKPEDEKRSLVIIHRRHYDDWLSCKNTEFARSFFHCYPASEMQAEAVKANQHVERQSSLF